MTTPETLERIDNILAKLDESDGMFVYGMLNKVEALQREITKLKEDIGYLKFAHEDMLYAMAEREDGNDFG